MSEHREVATLGGGCFWCTEAVLEQLRGVHGVVSGYAGGHVPNPTYQQVCGKGTGHAEVVQVTFDPREISFEELLEVFSPPTIQRRPTGRAPTSGRSIAPSSSTAPPSRSKRRNG
jgi:methionine-S-sulfoxide reductase